MTTAGRGEEASVLSIPDMAILGVLALLVFGEQKLPGIMRQAGRVMREVQNTSHAFVREMERAADFEDSPPPPAAYEPPMVEETRESPGEPVEPPPAEEPKL